MKHSNKGIKYDKIFVGAIILTDNRILLLKRTARETYYPNMFELPSGNIGPTDPSLTHALAREVEEETGLTATRVVEELLPPFEYETSKEYEVRQAVQSPQGWYETGKISNFEITNTCIQVNFLVEVEDGEVKVNPEEHSVAVWADEKKVGGLDMTDGMRGLVEKAFGQFGRTRS